MLKVVITTLPEKALIGHQPHKQVELLLEILHQHARQPHKQVELLPEILHQHAHQHHNQKDHPQILYDLQHLNLELAELQHQHAHHRTIIILDQDQELVLLHIQDLHQWAPCLEVVVAEEGDFLFNT